VTAAEFAAAVRGYRFEEHSLPTEALGRASASLEEAGLLVVGEPHGVRETPSVLYALAEALDTRALALEWSHEEVNDQLQAFAAGEPFDYDEFWALPPTSDFFAGDGRVSAGHFALLERLREEGRLEEAIAFDRVDAEPAPGWEVRDRELAERLLAQWQGPPLLVLTGAFHARLDDGTMAAHLAQARPGLAPAMLDYASGSCWSRGEHDVSGPMPDAPIAFRLPTATPAIVALRTSGGPAAVSTA
jgi:hypothetical protein